MERELVPEPWRDVPMGKWLVTLLVEADSAADALTLLREFEVVEVAAYSNGDEEL